MTKKELQRAEIDASTMLFSLCIEVHYTLETYDDYVHDLELCLKEAKKKRTAIKRKLKKMEERYEKLKGKPINYCRR